MASILTAQQHFAIYLGVATAAIVIFAILLLNIRKELTMSQSAPLAQAVSELSTSVAALATAVGNITATQTPDSDVTAAISSLSGVTKQVNDIVASLAP